MVTWGRLCSTSMHQIITIWKSNGIVEHIEVNQSFFCVEVNHIDKRNFSRQLASILPCTPARIGYDFKGADVYYSIKLHLMRGFMWEYETTRGYNRWSESDDNDV